LVPPGQAHSLHCASLTNLGCFGTPLNSLPCRSFTYDYIFWTAVFFPGRYNDFSMPAFLYPLSAASVFAFALLQLKKSFFHLFRQISRSSIGIFFWFPSTPCLCYFHILSFFGRDVIPNKVGGGKHDILKKC
jgi:hypothetical protein